MRKPTNKLQDRTPEDKVPSLHSSARAAQLNRQASDMTKPFAPEDFASLALSLRQTIANHKVPLDQQASLIEDVVFHFAAFIDEKTGSDIHESIFAVLRKYAKQLGETPVPSDSLLAEVQITFLKGRKAELNVLRSSIEKPALLRLIVEIALGVRDTTEIKARVDTDRRFADLMEKKRGVNAVRFRLANSADNASWQEVKLRRSPHGNFEQSVKGLSACIRAVVTKST
jgi:hypothetical protein